MNKIKETEFEVTLKNVTPNTPVPNIKNSSWGFRESPKEFGLYTAVMCHSLLK